MRRRHYFDEDHWKPIGELAREVEMELLEDRAYADHDDDRAAICRGCGQPLPEGRLDYCSEICVDIDRDRGLGRSAEILGRE